MNRVPAVVLPRPEMALVVAVLLSACSAEDAAAPAARQPVGWDEELALRLAEDVNPDPRVLEVHLEAREEEVDLGEGIRVKLWTYDGSVPGPLLRARRGDRLIVHFTNSLPEATTIHWHGVRVPVEMDGTPRVQAPVQPGESFTYDFVLPDAGTYWYHPHFDSSSQVGYGLYGALVVDEPEADPIEADDLVMVVSDLSLDADGQLAPGDESGWFGDYFGREGRVLLVNGKIRPTLRGRAGLPQRWRIINASRARFFQLAVPDAALARIAGDGGLIERPQRADHLRLVASERGELLVVPGSGTTEVLAQDADRFNLGFQQPAEVLFRFTVEGEAAADLPQLPETLREFPELDSSQAKERRIELGEVVVDGEAHLAINGRSHLDEQHEHHHEAEHVAFVGDTEIWEVVNSTSYDHPFHLHGFFFEVLDVNGSAWPVREWKDTVNAPAGKTVRFAVTFDDRPGSWMFHCHILDHVNLGMMATLDVLPRP